MSSCMRRLVICFTSAVFVIAAVGSAVFGQEDPDPNSPAPRLLSSMDKTRLLAIRPQSAGPELPATGDAVFDVDGEMAVYVENIPRTSPDGANAFRAYLTQSDGRIYELYTTSFRRLKSGVAAIGIRIRDVYGYRGQPKPIGDSLLSIVWRGNVSNYLKVGIGTTGGRIRIPEAAATRVNDGGAEYVGYRWSGDRIRFLEQATFGPSPAEDERIRRIGLRAWLAEQFNAPYPYLQMPNPPQMPTSIPTECSLAAFPACYRDRYTMTPLQLWFFREAAYGNAQLRHRVAWALSQILVTSGLVTQQSSHAIAYHRILQDNAFGNYKDILRSVTLSPTMGNYLDMARSTKTNPNENYPREILQLFSIGLFMLEQDGRLRLDGDGHPIPTYDQDLINEFSKVFTGWSFNNTGPHATPGTVNYLDPMILSTANHDLSAKTLMSYHGASVTSIPACQNCTTTTQIRDYADASLDAAITNIFEHPNVGPYISRLLIQHMVTSDPSPAYVEHVAAAFNDNGSGIRGDMKAVVRAILLDPEARGDVKTAPRYGKLREPVQLITNLTRIFPARSYDGQDLSDGALGSWAAAMGQNPFNSPSVFNYFSPKHVVSGTTILGPEFELLNSGLAVNRTNFLHLLTIDGITPNATDSLRGTSLDLSAYAALAAEDPTGNLLLDTLDYRMMHRTMTQQQKGLILQAVNAVAATDPLRRAKTAVYLIAASSQYQVQR